MALDANPSRQGVSGTGGKDYWGVFGLYFFYFFFVFYSTIARLDIQGDFAKSILGGALTFCHRVKKSMHV